MPLAATTVLGIAGIVLSLPAWFYFLRGAVFLDYWGDANWQWPVYLHDDGYRWHPSYDPDGQKPL